MKVRELKGPKSLRSLNAFHALMYGLKMMPGYLRESYEEFFGRVALMTPKDQETVIREAAVFVEIQPPELEALLSFCEDPNGVPYSAENIKNLGPRELHECVVAVCCELAKIRIDLVSESEKKN